jgi:signal transduction histidine kinase/putative methionine-R-sulfoxide reductase with GAF domain
VDAVEDLPRPLHQFSGIGALYELAHSLITFDDLPALLQAVVDGACAAVNASWVLLVTFDVAKRQILDCVQGGADADPNLNLSFEALSEISRTHLWTPGQATLLTNERLLLNAEVPAFAAHFDRHFNSVIAAPLLYHDEMIGLLLTARPAAEPAFSEQDVVLVSIIANQATAALENFRLLASLSQEKAQLELLYRLGQHLSSSLDIYTVCQLALDEICTVFKGSYGLLFIVDAETEAMQLMAQVGFRDDILQFMMERFQAGEGLTGWVVKHRQMAVIDDVATDPRWIFAHQGEPPRSGVSVPLFNGEDVLGVMTLSAPGQAFFKPEYCRLLESAVATIAIAIFNAQLFSKVQQRAREQERISEIARALNALDMPRAFSVLVQSLGGLAECEPVVLALCDETRYNFTVVESTFLALPVGSILSLPPDVRVHVWGMQPHVCAVPGDEHGELLLADLQALGVCSRVILPLIVGERVMGVLYLGSHQTLTLAQVSTLQQIANTVAIAVENDRLFRAEQRHREVAERLQATALVVNTLDLQEVLTLIMDQLESIFPYDSGSVQILEQDAMCVLATRNAPHAPVGLCYPLKDYPYSRRLAEGEVVIIEDVQQHDMGWIPFNEALYMRSNIGVPLWVRDKVIGALTIDNRGVRKYTEEDIRVIQTFAQQAAIAIENARLFEAQRVQRELAEALEAAAAVVSSVLDFDQVLDYILDQVVRFVHGDTYNIILIEDGVGRMIRWRGYEEHQIAMPPQGRDNIPIMTYPSLAQMIEDGLPTFIVDTKHDPRWRIGRGQEKLNSYVAAPICIAGKTEGFINVAGLSSYQFGSQEAQRLKAFADHASIALQNARLYQKTLRHTEVLERRVRERTAELEAQNAWLEAVLGSTSDGMIIADSDGQIADANRVARMWLYHSLPSSDVERLRETIRDLAQRAHTRPDAVLELSGLDLELSASPIFGEQGAVRPAILIVVHDVSYLKALDRVKSQFVSNVSHELRTPLTSIRLYSSLIQRSTPENTERYFEPLDREVDRLSKLVEDILQISRIEAGQLELNRRVVDLNLLTEMAVMSHHILTDSRGLTMAYRATDGRTMVSVDYDKFIQVVNNLIENAINYTPAGGHIQVATECLEKDARPWAVVTVQDTGMGIPEQELRHLFERFFRGSEPQEMRIQGSGLGLAIVKEIVELHGGTITVESQVGVGSTFAVWIPLMEV